MVASQWRLVLKFTAVQHPVTESLKVPMFTLKSGRKGVRKVSECSMSSTGWGCLGE